MNRIFPQLGGTMHLLAIPFLTACILISGCSAPGGNSMEKSEGPTGLASNDGIFIVDWKTTPDPIPVNDFFLIDVKVFDAGTNDPSSDIELVVDAAMPRHRHGMNHSPDVQRAGPGHWRVRDMLFHMPGDWVIYFDIERDGVIRRAQVSIEVD